MKANPTTEVPPRALQLEMYYFLRLTRALDERAQILYRQGKVVGGLFSSLGQEAISIGSAFALEKGGYVGPMIRNSGTVLVRGHTPRDVMSNYLAKATSPTGGKKNCQQLSGNQPNGG